MNIITTSASDSKLPFIYVNGEKHFVDGPYQHDITLNEFIRNVLGLTGTKIMCREAGCGCCVVAASYPNEKDGKMITKSIATCITPLYSVLGWHITTIEGIGNSQKGYHPIPKKLADNYGSQCGYCSPGFVMTMFSRMQQDPLPNEKEIENLFDGNICRCTGYRPILETMKSFTGSAVDIEDIRKARCCKDINLSQTHLPTYGLQPVALGWQGERFFSPGSYSELMTLCDKHKEDDCVRLLCGNTSAGVFKDDANSAKIIINLRNVKELNFVKLDDRNSLRIGSTVTLNEMIENFKSIAADQPKAFGHLFKIAQHWERVANTAVRNVGSWAGNLMMKHAHREFPSDVFVTLLAAKAVVTLANKQGVQEVTLDDFLESDMRGRILLDLCLAPLAENFSNIYKSFKITPRRQNAHAYVNAAFNLQIDTGADCRVMTRPTLVYGGISDKFQHASRTENFLQNKSLTDPAVVAEALKILEAEVNPDVGDETHSSVAHRRNLATNLLFKALVFAQGDQATSEAASGANELERAISSGYQDYTESAGEQLLGKAIPKMTAEQQCSGEAVFTNDTPSNSNELFAAFALAKEGNAEIKSIDLANALKVPGVVRILIGQDLVDAGYCAEYNRGYTIIPCLEPEELLAMKYARYAGDPIAMVLAKSQSVANKAADLVEATLEQIDTPILSVNDAITKNSFHPSFSPTINHGDAEKALTNAPVQIEGEVFMDEQYHFYMEQLVIRVVPVENGLEVTASTQFASLFQQAIAAYCNLPVNKVRVSISRLGGAFGGKATRFVQAACGVSAACCITGRAVRMTLDLQRNMEMIGRRFALLAKYKVGASMEGRLQSVIVNTYPDNGWSNNDFYMAEEVINSMDNAFHCDNWLLKNHSCKTHKPTMTACRAPGPFPASVIMNTILDHVAHRTKQDAIQVKYLNLYRDGMITIWDFPCQNSNFSRMWPQLMTSAKIEQRIKEIDEFNRLNKFRKRGLDVSATSYQMSLSGQAYSCLLNVYKDGTVNLSHSGHEMGQGIHVKACQVVADVLGIPINDIKVLATDTFSSTASCTGGSVTSELCCQAAFEAAQQLKSKLEPAREDLKEDSTWKDLIAAAFKKNIDCSALGSFHSKPCGRKFDYSTTGTGACEVELDCLTGEYQIRRADILMDCGNCINPGVDIGQIEGAFMFGIGSLFMERNIYDKDSGALLSNGTWNYKPPCSHDVPIDFRVTILSDSDNPRGLKLGNKAIGEPPICLAVTASLALRRCIEAFRRDQGKPDIYFKLDYPALPHAVLELLSVDAGDRKW